MRLLKEYLLIGFLSGFLGIAVAMPFLPLFQIGGLEYALKSGLCGLVIGVSIKTAFLFFYRNVLKRTKLSFLIMTGTISVFTFLAAYFMGLRIWYYTLLMVLLADAVGMAVNISIYRFTLRINQKLQEEQARLREAKQTDGGE